MDGEDRDRDAAAAVAGVAGVGGAGGNGSPFDLRATIDGALARARADAAAEEAARRADPAREGRFAFEDWLGEALARAADGGDDGDGDGEGEEGEDAKPPAARGDSDDDGASSWDEEPSRKKARGGARTGAEEPGEEYEEDEDDDDDDDEDAFDDADLMRPIDCLDDLHKDDDDLDESASVLRQIEVLGPYLFGRGRVPDALFWRALWSTESKHDVPHFGGYRVRHFFRWEREEVGEEDPWRSLESKALYFPGKYASHDAKSAWAGVVVEESCGNDIRPAFDTTWPRDRGIPTLDEVGDFIADILAACAPDKLSVCLYIKRKMIDSFLSPAVLQEEEKERPLSVGTDTTDEEWEEIRRRSELSRYQPGIDSVFKFLSSPYLREDAPNDKVPSSSSEEYVEEKLGVFKEWLKGSPPVGTLHQEPVLTKLPPKRYDKLTSGNTRRSDLLKDAGSEDDLVLLARRHDVPKTADTEKVLEDMVEKLGLNETIVGINPTSSRNLDVHGYAYGAREKLGGNIHYPDENGKTSVAFTWSSTQKFTEEHLKHRLYRQSFQTGFLTRARERRDASNGRLCHLLWPRGRSDEKDGFFSRQNPTPVTSENAHIIWLPGDYQKIEDEAFEMFLDGVGTTVHCFRMTGTRDGNQFWDSMMRYFKRFVVNGVDAPLVGECGEEDDDEDVERYKSIPNKHSLKMCHLLALTRVFKEAADLMLDHEFPEEEIRQFFDQFGQEWRRVLRLSDETLGFGLRVSSAHTRAIASKDVGQIADMRALSEQTPAHSREGLCAFLTFHGSWIEEEFYYYDNIQVSLVPSGDDGNDDADNVESDNESD